MRAQDIMTRTVTTARPDTKLVDLANRMVAERISGLPVVDAGGKLVGVVTEGDLLRRCETGTEAQHGGFFALFRGPGRLADEYVRSHGRTVADVMTTDVLSVTEDTELADIVDMMIKRHIKRVPVVQGDALVGLVSRADIVRQLATKLNAQQPPAHPVDDATIAHAVRTELANAKWANAHNVIVSVNAGVVSLEGVIFNESIRDALRVAAENTEGVTKVEDHMVWVEPVTGAALGA